MPGQPSATTILIEIACAASRTVNDEKLEYWITELSRLINDSKPPLPKLMQNGLRRCGDHLRGERLRRQFVRDAQARKQQ